MTDKFLDSFLSPGDVAKDDGPLPDAGTTPEPKDEKNGQETLEDRVIAAIRTIYDPEIPVNVYDLGLIYELDVADGGAVRVRMTLTSPMCPVAEILPEQVDHAVRMTQGVTDVDFELIWDPPWHPDRLSEDVRLELGLL